MLFAMTVNMRRTRLVLMSPTICSMPNFIACLLPVAAHTSAHYSLCGGHELV